MNKIVYFCSMCGDEMNKTIGTADSRGNFKMVLSCSACHNSLIMADRLYYCRVCKGEMDKLMEGGHTVLKCSKCNNGWRSLKPTYKVGNAWKEGKPPKILIIHCSELQDEDELEEGQDLKERIAWWIDKRFDFVLYDFECKIKGENVVVFNINKINEEDEANKKKLDEQQDEFDSPDRSFLKTDEEIKRIQEEEGFSDEDMEDGAWIDF